MMQQSAIVESIGKIKASQGELNELIQATAISVIGHAMFHGDVTLGDTLLEACKGSDRKALVTYLKTFGPFNVDAQTGKFGLNKKYRNEHQFDEQSLTDGVKWYEFAPSVKKVMSSFDVAKRALSLVKQAEEKASEGKEVENLQLVQYLTAAVKQYNKDKAEALRAAFEGGTVEVETVEVETVEVERKAA